MTRIRCEVAPARRGLVRCGLVQLMLGVGALCACTLGLMAASASAALIDNGTSMIDDATNLEWLDLTLTQNISYLAAEASSFVTLDGYRHATTDEVNTLFLNAGFLTTNNVNNPLNNPAANQLLAFLGCTQFCGTVNATGRGFAAFGATGAYRPNYHTSGLGAGAVVISLFSTQASGVSYADSGHYLVRVVPEPGTALLVGLGLAALSARRRD